MLKIRSSTRAFLQEARQIPHFGIVDRIHGYLYARWPYRYIRIGTGEQRLGPWLSSLLTALLRWLSHFPLDRPRVTSGGLRIRPPKNGDIGDGRCFADTYHGKVLPLAAAQKLMRVNREVHLTDLDRVIPYSRARDLILRQPAHILLLECPCRSARPNPCRPLDVCLIMGEPFAGFAAEHYNHRARWITTDEALGVLEAADKRGNLHHAFFKEAMLNRFYAICNCCTCCCGALQAHRNGVPMLAPSGYVGRVNPDRCTGCGTCGSVCFFGAATLSGPRATVDPARCMGCGICASHCPADAISLVREPKRGHPLEIDELIDGVCVASAGKTTESDFR
jgi:ferredoxin